MDKGKSAKFSRESNRMSISSFSELNELGKYSFPDYQRSDSVWGVDQQSFLIDSLMKNFPIPSIFLKSITDNETGKTKYEVIDGQQRLTSIIKFIKNEIPLPDNFGEDDWGDENLNGMFLKEIPNDSPYRNNFWGYHIPVEYITSEDEKSISTIFDRLNRNGMPLNSQELRNSQFKDSYLLKNLKELANIPYWENLLSKLVGKNRMQDIDFISELFFTLAVGDALDSSPVEIDNLYRDWANIPDKHSKKEIDDLVEEFKKVTNILEKMNLDYKKYKIFGVSHIYGLWLLSKSFVDKPQVELNAIKNSLEQFFENIRDKNYSDENVALYKESMSYGTKSKAQRNKRFNSLIAYLEKI